MRKLFFNIRFRKGFIFTLFVILSFVNILPSFALTIQEDYIVPVGEGNLVFVMLATAEDYLAIRDEEIRQTYAASGLYDEFDNEKAIWTVDWYAPNVLISDDGTSLIRLGPDQFATNFDPAALQFYRHGEFIKGYSVRDLVATPLRIPSYGFWYSEIEFSGDQTQLIVETHTGRLYKFDVSSGEYVEGSILGSTRRRFRAVVLVVLFGCFIAGQLIRRGRQFFSRGS